MLFSSISPSPSETYTLSLHDALPISAMQTELAKVKTTIEVKEENSAISCVLYGKAKWKDKAKFETYEDHRMAMALRSEEHTSELQSPCNLVCRLLLEKKNQKYTRTQI